LKPQQTLSNQNNNFQSSEEMLSHTDNHNISYTRKTIASTVAIAYPQRRMLDGPPLQVAGVMVRQATVQSSSSIFKDYSVTLNLKS
jgi:hypothetical protein